MVTRRRRFTVALKKRVVLEALRGEQPVQAIAAKHQFHPNQVSAWKRQAVEGLDEVFSGPRAKGRSEHEETIREVIRVVWTGCQGVLRACKGSCPHSRSGCVTGR